MDNKVKDVKFVSNTFSETIVLPDEMARMRRRNFVL